MQVDNNLFHLLESRQLLEIECVRQSAKRRRLEKWKAWQRLNQRYPAAD